MNASIEIWDEYNRQFNRACTDNIRVGCEAFTMRQPVDQGSRKAIVLIHGLSDSPHYMRALAAHFYTREYNVYAPLLDFHGRNDLTSTSGISLEKWLDNAQWAIGQARAEGAANISIGGLSTGGALSFFLSEIPALINGATFLFSAALDLAGGPAGILGELKEIGARHKLPIFASEIKEFLTPREELDGESPYKYIDVDLYSAHELARLMKRNDQIIKRYGAGSLRQKWVFAAHSESDATASIQGIEDLQRVSSAERFHIYKIAKSLQVSHPSLVLNADVVSTKSGRVLEKKNPQFQTLLKELDKFIELLPVD